MLIAAAIWYVGWVLLSKPIAILGDATPYPCLPLLLPAGVTALAVGLTVELAMHAHRPRIGTVRVALGVTLVALAATGLAGGICQHWPVAMLIGSVLLPAGLVVIAHAVRLADRPVRLTGDLVHRGSAFAFIPVTAMISAAGYRVSAGGIVDGTGLVAASVAGLMLVSRQYLALIDVRRYTLQLSHSEKHFRELAHTDPLTGLANRRGLVRALREPDPDGRQRFLVGIDLDGFKNVNDMRGHDVGDDVLAEVGARLRRNLLHGDVAARLGGDEFAVLMHATDDEALLAAKRLLAVLGEPYDVDGATVFLSASVGVAGQPGPSDTGELMRDADLALRYAKMRGKNRVERYEVRYDELLRRRNTLETELRHAIERDELNLVFQPVVALPSMRPVGAEALLRWHHPTLGNVRPDEFIPVAEESGTLGQLRTLPVDILKIDQRLVAEPESRTGTAAPLVDVVVRLGHRLGLEVLAEGIQTPAQRAVVEEAGCRLGQGSLFGWGVPAEHLESQLRTLRPAGAKKPLPVQQRPTPSGVARSQVVLLGPGMRQLRALLPADQGVEAPLSDQNVGSVDSPREIGQG